MRLSKKVFIVTALVFLLALGYVSYDIASKTTFPGSRPQLQERIQKKYFNEKADSSAKDVTSTGPQ